jgi:hypothetical protein
MMTKALGKIKFEKCRDELGFIKIIERNEKEIGSYSISKGNVGTKDATVDPSRDTDSH